MRWKKRGTIFIGEDDDFVYRKNVAMFHFNTIFNARYQVTSEEFLNKIRRKSRTHSIVIIDESKHENKSKRAIKNLNLRFLAFINTEDNGFSVPYPTLGFIIRGMFRRKKELSDIFYCGRRAGVGKESSKDRAFAFNVGIDFKTRDEFYFPRKKSAPWSWKDAVPYEKRKDFLNAKYPNIIDEIKKFPKNPYYLILIIGPTFSGKMEIAKMIKEKWEGEIEIGNYFSAINAFSNQKSAILMGEYGNKIKRKKYIDLAVREMIPILIVETEATDMERKMMYFARRYKDTSWKELKFETNGYYNNYEMPDNDTYGSPHNPRVFKVVTHPVPFIDDKSYWGHY